MKLIHRYKLFALRYLG